MASWQPLCNLRDYVSQNPPAVTFFLCLLMLAISFICLSSYSNNHPLPNPDTAKDWNHLLSTLAHYHLCVKTNWSLDELVSRGPSPLREQKRNRDTSLDLTQQPAHVSSLHVKVPLTITSSHGLPKDVDVFTTLRASQLDLGGNEIVDVDIHHENDTYTCLTLRASTGLFPMRRLPPECPAPSNIHPSVHVEATDQPPPTSQACYGLLYRNDPTLTIMLTKEERWVAVRHLLEVSMCLIGVCLILCLAASLSHSKMRNYHRKEPDLQNEPLIDT